MQKSISPPLFYLFCVYNIDKQSNIYTLTETKDVIYLQCAFKEKDAYEILIAVEGEFKIYDSEEFEKRVNGRPDLNGTKWDIKPESDNNKALRLVKYFNFNEDDEVVEFLKNLIEQITKSKN